MIEITEVRVSLRSDEISSESSSRRATQSVAVGVSIVADIGSLIAPCETAMSGPCVKRRNTDGSARCRGESAQFLRANRPRRGRFADRLWYAA